MNTEHTPGPWGLQTLTTNHHGYDWPVFCIRSGWSAIGGNCLATVGDVDRFTAERNEANARLIAAAPELLAALTNLLQQADEDCPVELRTGHFFTAMDDARAAIAKATSNL